MTPKYHLGSIGKDTRVSDLKKELAEAREELVRLKGDKLLFEDWLISLRKKGKEGDGKWRACDHKGLWSNKEKQAFKRKLRVAFIKSGFEREKVDKILGTSELDDLFVPKAFIKLRAERDALLRRIERDQEHYNKVNKHNKKAWDMLKRLREDLEEKAKNKYGKGNAWNPYQEFLDKHFPGTNTSAISSKLVEKEAE